MCKQCFVASQEINKEAKVDLLFVLMNYGKQIGFTNTNKLCHRLWLSYLKKIFLFLIFYMKGADFLSIWEFPLK